MALTVTLLGVSYSIPEPGDNGYDQALTNYLKALATAFPQLNGGTQSLTAELDFGTSFGVKAAWFKSETANPASAGQLRLAKTDTVKFRNNANGADLALAIDTGDALTFSGANVTGNPMLGANTTAAQSINSGAVTIVVYGTVETDTDSGYNSGTGRYTIPTGKGGHYIVSACASWGVNGASAGAVQYGLFVFKNAAEAHSLYDLAITPGTTLQANDTMCGSTILNLSAGDIVDIRAFQNSGGAMTLSATSTRNRFTLKRIPT